jgi:hypothetical protein
LLVDCAIDLLHAGRRRAPRATGDGRRATRFLLLSDR